MTKWESRHRIRDPDPPPSNAKFVVPANGDPLAFVQATLDSRDPAPAKAGGGNNDMRAAIIAGGIIAMLVKTLVQKGR